MNRKRHGRRSNEKVISIRLSKIQHAKYNELKSKKNVSNKDIFVFGMLKMIEEMKNDNELELLSALKFLEEENYEYDLRVIANNILIEKINEKLQKHSSDRKFTKESKVVGLIAEEHERFRNNPKYSEDERCDIDMFYAYCESAISIHAMSYDMEYEHAIKLYEKYLDKKMELEYEDIIQSDETLS